MDELYKEVAPELLRSARAAGRRIAAIGGGTGLSTLLLGLKEYSDNITAIVTVTDDGGGSGRIRSEFGMLPPGDLRNCLLALANTSTMMNDVLNYRFTEGSLKGQSFGNLFLLALNGVCGSFEQAVANMNRILAVTGRVLPVTDQNIDLVALFENGELIQGETSITGHKKRSGQNICQVSLIPKAPAALPDVITAIKEAELIVLGPGSLYTSVIPNLLVSGVSEALRESKALRVYVMNIMTQEGETEHYSARRHIEEINAHAGGKVIDACIYNTRPIHRNLAMRYAMEDSNQIITDPEPIRQMGVSVFGADVLSRNSQLARHDPIMLAHQILRIADNLAPREEELRKYDRLLLEE